MSKLDDQDVQVAALLAEGLSFRLVAGRLGMSLGGVQRAAKRARKATAEPAATLFDADPALVEQAAELDRMGLSQREVAGYLGFGVGHVMNELELYRAAGMAVKKHAGTLGDAGPVVEWTSHYRDLRVMEMHLEGLSNADIGRACVPPIAKGTVSRIISRLEDEGIDLDDDFGEPVEGAAPARVVPQRGAGAARAGWRDTDPLS